MNKIWTILELITETAVYFRKKGISTARLDAELLLAHCLQKERIQLYITFDQPITGDVLSAYREIVRRRAGGEPVAYLIGCREFWSLKIKVVKGVLIPRPETELLVEETLKIVKSADADGTSCSMLELGTGSGAISVALAKELKHSFHYATDISTVALQTARDNARECGFTARISFIHGYSLSSFKNRELFDIILSNPPYIRSGAIAALPVEIKDYEPLDALDGGSDGLRWYREWIPQLPSVLKKGGWVLFEIGEGQTSAITRLFAATGVYNPAQIVKDFAGHDRVILAQKQ
jgi:release factor glutamine methyltransferase